MSGTQQRRDDGKASATVGPTFALLANGSSGRWSVTLDESAGPAEGYYLQIEGPSLHLFCEVDHPDIVDRLASALAESAEPSAPLALGQLNGTLLRVQRDAEDATAVYLTIGPEATPLARYSIQGRDVKELSAALEQAAADLN